MLLQTNNSTLSSSKSLISPGSSILSGSVSCLLSSAYFPPLDYFVAMVNTKQTYIEAQERYQKQSYRTRTHIYSSEGVYPLSVPVMRGGSSRDHRVPIKEIKIDYSENWIQQHQRAMIAAYMNSPYFEYYADDFFSILNKKETFLFDLNNSLLSLLIELITVNVKVEYTESYEQPSLLFPDGVSGYFHPSYSASPIVDLRSKIHPKYSGESLLSEMGMEKPYFQVFSRKQGFISNLSILDLLCNEGPNSISFLRKVKI
jgi:hypothetical protein